MSRFSLSLNEAPPPLAAIEVAGGRVSGVAVDVRGGRPVVVAHITAALPDAAVVPTLNAQNVRDRRAVAGVVARVLERIGRPRRVGLVIDDPAVKVSIVRLQQVPSNPQDLDQVIRWQVRKATPFAIEDAQVGYQAGLKAEDGQDFVVTVARRDVIAEYESLFDGAGAHAGIVDLATFNIINTRLASGGTLPGDWLLVNAGRGWTSIAIMRGANVVFFRNRVEDSDGTLSDLVHQTAMYYQDRLDGPGFGRVVLAGATNLADAVAVRGAIGDRLGMAVDTCDAAGAVTFAKPFLADERGLDALTGVLGMVLRSGAAS